MKKKRGLKRKREKRNFKAVNKKARGKQNFFSFSDFFLESKGNKFQNSRSTV